MNIYRHFKSYLYVLQFNIRIPKHCVYRFLVIVLNVYHIAIKTSYKNNSELQVMITEFCIKSLKSKV